MRLLPLELVDEVDGILEADALALMDRGNPQRCRGMGFLGSRSADQDQILRRFHKGRGGQCLDVGLCQRCFGPVDAGEIAMRREPRCLELVAQAAKLAIGEFGRRGPSASNSLQVVAMP